MRYSRCRFTRFARTALAGGVLMLPPAAADAGGLNFVEAFDAYSVPSLDSPNAVAVSPDGAYVFVAADESRGSLVIWDRNPITCELTAPGAWHDGQFGVDNMKEPTAVAGSPDGLCLYATSSNDDSIVIFGGAGFVGFRKDGQGGVDGLRGARALALSGDDRHVYVAGYLDDAIAVFERSGCDLVFVAAEPTIARPEAIALSPDGAYLYVAGSDPPMVAVHGRDAMTGALTPPAAQPIDRLVAHVSAIAVHLDNVYIALADANAVVVYTRHTADGTLAWLETEHDGVGKGLGGASGIAVSPDGRYVYVSAADGLTTFARDGTDGRLRFLEFRDRFVDDDGLENALDRLQDVAVSPDGRCVYAVGGSYGSLAVAAVDACGNGTRGIDEQCDDHNAVSGDGCSDTCRIERCGPAPITGCRTTIRPGGASLTIRDLVDDTRDQLSFSWRGQATARADFGDPTTAASYVLCVYDGSGGAQPRSSRAAPAGGACGNKSCWKAASRSFRYQDKLLTPDGIKQVQLKEGLVDGAASIRFDGFGILLSPTTPLTLPVTVQVANIETNTCWEATFSSALVNTSTAFKGRSQ